VDDITTEAELRELLDPETWQPDVIASRARIAHQQERAGEPLEDIERYYSEAYAAGLYPST
jgi:hypothetical protein